MYIEYRYLLGLYFRECALQYHISFDFYTFLFIFYATVTAVESTNHAITFSINKIIKYKLNSTLRNYLIKQPKLLHSLCSWFKIQSHTAAIRFL